MKTGWRKLTRKERLEILAVEGTLLCPAQAALAWRRLLGKMIELSIPDSPATPKFEDLMSAIIAGIVHGRRLKMPTVSTSDPMSGHQPTSQNAP